MKVSVLVPYRSDGGHRQKTWEWLAARWAGPHEHSFGHPTNAQQQLLFDRYAAARDDRDAMRSLIAER